MTGKGCTPAVYWLNAFVLDAAKSDISSRFKRRVEDHRRSKGRLALLSRPVTRQEVADHRNAAIVGGVVGYPPGFHNDIDYLAPLIL
ncbi:MAG: hypothetical protein ACK2TV_04560 [Anaerolineales bacterium]